MDMNPLFLMFPAAISTSFSFMLPVATPPNAMAFARGRIRVIDMVTRVQFYFKCATQHLPLCSSNNIQWTHRIKTAHDESHN